MLLAYVAHVYDLLCHRVPPMIGTSVDSVDVVCATTNRKLFDNSETHCVYEYGCNVRISRLLCGLE